MFQIIYISAATEPMEADALTDLLATCRANNARLDLTGLLAYKDERFMEALEGPRESIKRMYDTITEDRRHEGLIQLVGQSIEERDFPGQPMAFCTTDPPEDALSVKTEAASPLPAQPSGDERCFSHRMFLDFVGAAPRS